MGYSVRIRLLGGRLKIKSENRLRAAEREGKVPVWRCGNTWFVWEKSAPKPAQTQKHLSSQ